MESFLSFTREAERAKGKRAKRISFIVEDLSLVYLSFLGLKILVVTPRNVSFSNCGSFFCCPLFHTGLSKMIRLNISIESLTCFPWSPEFLKNGSLKF